MMKKIRYEEKHREFFKEYTAGHSHIEIKEGFNRQFDKDITVEQVKGYIQNHKLSTGRTGRYEKGNVPHNKGKKCKSTGRMAETQFKKGNTPHNHKPVGSERITKDGYTEVKIEEPKKWITKQRLIWEQLNGPIPKHYCILFKDKDKSNLAINNLALISRNELKILNKNKLIFDNSNLTESGILVAKIVDKISKIKHKEGENG